MVSATAQQPLAAIRTDPQVEDNDLNQLIGYRLKRAFNEIHLDLRKGLQPLGLRLITFTVLTMLKENPGLRQFQLARAIDVEKPNLVALIDELQDSGLIERAADPDDGRAWQLFLTAAGAARQREAFLVAQRQEARFLATLPSGERQLLFDALDTLRSVGSLSTTKMKDHAKMETPS